MDMPFEFIQIPVNGQGCAKEKLNRHRRDGRIASVRKEFMANGEDSFRAFCVEYLDGSVGVVDRVRGAIGPNVDYKELLNEKQFSVFVRLRDLCKVLSEREAIPAYSTFRVQQHRVRNSSLLRSTVPDGAMSMEMNRPPSRSHPVDEYNNITSSTPLHRASSLPSIISSRDLRPLP